MIVSQRIHEDVVAIPAITNHYCKRLCHVAANRGLDPGQPTVNPRKTPWTSPMSEHRREMLPTDHPRWQIQVTDDGSRTLASRDSRVAFHSGSGALTETRHVYLENSDVARRLSQQIETSVLEVGLGTAMGMLLTLAAPRAANTMLHYEAVELQWLPARLIRQLHPHDWVADEDLVEQFLSWRETLPEEPDEGTYRWNIDRYRQATVHVGRLENWTRPAGKPFDAVYFDPFAPDVSAQLWAEPILARMYSWLSPGGRLVSYCVRRQVRDLLRTVGFDVQSVPGPPRGKREVLVATRPC
jgi:tRNA U34 5-methylaminomethyl-2-thiouridine-forming methyltransferase MnmC